ncbi:hypothetical protein DCC85_00070 [Paenibacillus sp. CAA11]|uniref:hypothetical protein n=1 Tax=Paenibacillus sp. CAA11 TaxID=1532905 RepID=UPI000D3C5EB0|nr:hypothetical protein [Paenibacillus sp. CAA11]AWB42790.1 hypothetical protein DCC85_00070 [Paenibacillus sp. CAA11]
MDVAEKNTNATYYQYRLLKKIAFPNPFIHSLLVIPFIWLITALILWGWMSFVYVLLAAPVAYWIQYVISRSVLIIISHSYRKRWHHSLKMPWIGYMPGQFVAYGTMRKVTIHTAWIGFCLAAILLPWCPPALVGSLFFWHIWLLIPRTYAFIGMHGQRKDGMIKFNENDVSYYMP